MNLGHHSKRWFSWSKPYKIEAMITSLTEMLELPNFDHIMNLQFNLIQEVKFC